MTLALTLQQPWMVLDLGAMHRVLSFAPFRPGYVAARHIVWREVRNADLTPDLDVDQWFSAEMLQAGQGQAVGLLTSRDIRRFRMAEAVVEGVQATCLATVGLGNAERIGHRRMAEPAGYGTINIAVQIEAALTDTALLEAMTIATQARTTAVQDAGLQLPTGLATGTGTDCIAIAAHPVDGVTPPHGFAGLHTALGQAIGQAVVTAVSGGVEDWMIEFDGALPCLP